MQEVEERLAQLSGDEREKTVSIATAKLAFPTIKELAGKVMEKYQGIQVHVYCIENRFFGELIHGVRSSYRAGYPGTAF